MFELSCLFPSPNTPVHYYIFCRSLEINPVLCPSSLFHPYFGGKFCMRYYNVYVQLVIPEDWLLAENCVVKVTGELLTELFDIQQAVNVNTFENNVS